MESDRWARVKALFHDLVERPFADREAWLRAACAGDEALRLELVTLLQAHDAPEAILDRPAELPFGLADTAGGFEGTRRSRVGQRLGVWEIAGELGAGGMGQVYLARRADGQFVQEAALKIVKRGMDSELIVRRFLAERQILAGLDHPNICRLLDGGMSGDGVPYFVMERLDGEPLDEHCQRHDPPLRRRLELFVAICDAVQHAHQRLVVHRDIKPRNVLVTAAGVPKLLDFGLAKLLSPEDDATQTAARMMTLAYASPEQVRGAAVSTATDVHALGVLLYELVAGAHPFARDGRVSSDVARAIVDEEPPPPSAVARDPRLRRALRGDLDNIVAMALRKDPARRYASAEQLGSDVARHLRDEPVQARRDTLAYRAAKFVRRHRLVVAAAAAAVISLATATILTARQAHLLARERDVAAAERDKARRVSELVVSLFDADPLADTAQESDLVTLREFLTRSETTVRRELAAQPELEATLLSLLTRMYGRLGRLEDARRLGDEALALRERAGDRDSAELATTLTALATVEQDQGDYEPAERHFRRALAIREGLYGEVHADTAEAVNNLAVLIGNARPKDPDAVALARRGLELRRRVFGDDHPDTAQSMNVLAASLTTREAPGDREEAARIYPEAIAVRARHLGDRHPSVATTRSNYAVLLRDLGRYAESAAMFRTAIADLTASLGPEHPRVAAALFGLSKTLAELGQLDEAEEALRRSMAIDDKTLPPDHPYRAMNQKTLEELRRRAGKAP